MPGSYQPRPARPLSWDSLTQQGERAGHLNWVLCRARGLVSVFLGDPRVYTWGAGDFCPSETKSCAYPSGSFHASLSWIFGGPADALWSSFEDTPFGVSFPDHPSKTISARPPATPPGPPNTSWTPPPRLFKAWAQRDPDQSVRGYIGRVLWLGLCPPPRCRAPEGQRPDATLQAKLKASFRPLGLPCKVSQCS